MATNKPTIESATRSNPTECGKQPTSETTEASDERLSFENEPERLKSSFRFSPEVKEQIDCSRRGNKMSKFMSDADIELNISIDEDCSLSNTKLFLEEYVVAILKNRLGVSISEIVSFLGNEEFSDYSVEEKHDATMGMFMSGAACGRIWSPSRDAR